VAEPLLVLRHPRCTSWRCPASLVAELLPVFTRKPLFAYKVAAAGMVGVALLSFFVWQHHLFQSGINPDMRPLFMLTTELTPYPPGSSSWWVWEPCTGEDPI